jgi:hypothetical protein
VIELYQAHWFTVFIVCATLLVPPLYWFVILPREKALRLAWITLLVGGAAATAVLFNVMQYLGPAGGVLILGMWFVPAALVWRYRLWFGKIEQRNLIALQCFRAIGAVFLIEMARGYVAPTFAWPAGIGDIIVGVLALYLILNYQTIPRWGVASVLILGVIDFASAFFFGFTSLPGPAQLFAIGFENNVNLFPTGLIPLFLVPYAIMFHVLSFAQLREGHVATRVQSRARSGR